MCNYCLLQVNKVLRFPYFMSVRNTKPFGNDFIMITGEMKA